AARPRRHRAPLPQARDPGGDAAAQPPHLRPRCLLIRLARPSALTTEDQPRRMVISAMFRSPDPVESLPSGDGSATQSGTRFADPADLSRRPSEAHPAAAAAAAP